ncbi:MAG: DNA repair protein RecN, partial [Treponema sp.]|nr:DNA repair protein RecN [Treponema sp.]
KDFALIDSSSVEFSKGFSVLSGETGAGKSILIGAISFLLGGKAGAESIRAGCQEASVSGVFSLPPKSPSDRDLSMETEEEPLSAREWLSQRGIEDEDGQIILRRVVRAGGKSGAWIQGTPVPRADLAKFSEFLIDIHGQHEHQSLMRVAEHRKFLDSYCGVVEEVSAFTKLYAALVEKRSALEALSASGAERERRVDYLKYSIQEIEDAKLKASEDEELAAEEAKLSSFEKLYSEVQRVNEIFSGEEGGVEALFKQLRSSSEKAAALDKNLEELDGRVQNAWYELSDLSQSFRSYQNSLVFDPARLEEVQNRLDLIYKLKKKYASSVDSPLAAVFEYLSQAKAELETLDSSSINKESLEKEIAALERQVYEAAKAISAKRQAGAAKMSAQVEAVLQKLGMAGTKFSVSISQKAGDAVEQKCGPYGMDDIEFLISANPGSPLASLSKIASGGELSRVMLALKTIFAQSDKVPTLIFDEIDTGIGGEVAVAVGEHMKNLAKNRQILCITHLASIAVFADNQIRIQKSVESGVMKTRAAPVLGEERVAEIARMLSGDQESAESLDHARSMLKKYANLPQ